MITSVSLIEEAPLDFDRANLWLMRLLRDRGGEILRCKGILSIAGELEQFVFQGVHMVLDRAAGRPWRPAGNRTSKLVFGRKLDAVELLQALNGCVAEGRR